MTIRDVVVIGAGPAGAVAAALLKRRGHDILVLERQRFPRFSIGESLLAHCLEFIEEAGMMPAVEADGFQKKNGAAFAWGDRYTVFDFRDKFSPGPATTFQVQRARFDKILADDAVRQGVEIRYEQEVTAAEFSRAGASLDVRDLNSGRSERIRARFVLDASGYGRVLARLLKLERPSRMPPRSAIFSHVEDRIQDVHFDREKILITVHPEDRGVWYWLIPFSDGRCSLGVVGDTSLVEAHPDSLDDALRHWIHAAPNLRRLLHDAVWDTPARVMAGYSASVSRLHGPGFALLGNAAEFLDPVFSSGVTIALKSAKLAADALHRQLSGERVSWDEEFSAPLMQGVDTFRAYVQGWYDGVFQDIVFYENADPQLKRMICAILAGYAWDTTNPFVRKPGPRLNMLAQLCNTTFAAANHDYLAQT